MKKGGKSYPSFVQKRNEVLLNMSNINIGKRLCIGCGVCSGICDYIKMIMDDTGAFIPQVDLNKCKQCGKCVMICPFSESIKNEDEIGRLLYQNIKNINYRRETGYYLSCYEGYEEIHRNSSASGGIVTLFLEFCLENKIVDEVVCVGSCNEDGKLFQYRFVNNQDDLTKYSRSAYYPVELSTVLKKIKQSNKKVAITVLPCVAKAIRLAAQFDKTLKDKIKIIIALTCGGLPRKTMVDYVAMKNGFRSDSIKELKFKVKDENYLNKNYSMQMLLENKIITSRLHGEDFGFAFLNGLFRNFACNCCDDIYGECADISAMDAWLDVYDQDKFGTSIVITRSELAEGIMKELALSIKTISKVSIDRAIDAQSRVGLVFRKKKAAYVRTKFYRCIGYKVGNKRVTNKISLKRKMIILLRSYLEYTQQLKSAKLWKLVQDKKLTIDEYDSIMKKTVTRNKKLSRRK